MPKKVTGSEAKGATKKAKATKAAKTTKTTKTTKTAKAAKAAKATRRGKASSTSGEPKAASAATVLRVRQVRSGIGHAEIYRRTLRALGLKHHQDEVLVKDGSSTRGMLRKVHHLVRVTREEA